MCICSFAGRSNNCRTITSKRSFAQGEIILALDEYIVLKNVTKHFGNTVAVDNVSFTVNQGEFFSLLGHSGCGKTTLLRILAGFEYPSQGEVTIDGISMARVPAYRRPTNMVFQSHALFPHLTVWQNVGYGLRKEKIDRKERRRRIEAALAMVKLEEFGKRKPNQLSGGQCQRVALARALIKKPKVLLLDEPISALDKKLREAMQIELRELQRSVGITFLYVTHDQEEALTMSDRVAVMFDGRVVQVDTPRKLYYHPVSRQVAGFIGQMNFLSAKVISTKDSYKKLECAGIGSLEIKNNASLKVGDSVSIAVRPENLILSSSPPVKDQIGVTGILQNSAFLGDRVHHLVGVDGIEKPLMVSAMAASDEGLIVESRKIWVVVDSTNLLIFKDS
jgi:spermidine/putrescine ABC transporter ATP-binding subunit